MPSLFDEKEGPRQQQNGTAPDSTSAGKTTLVAASQPAQAQQQQAPGPAAGDSIAITAPPGSPAHRIQMAAAANDVGQVVAIQGELLQHQPRTDEINQAVVAARHWMMERVAAIRTQYAPRLSSAQTQSRAVAGTTFSGAGGGGALQNVEAVEIEMDRECSPYLNGLAHGDPSSRYLHSSNEITAQVFSAVRLHGARRGADQIGHRAEAEAEARTDAGLPHGAWCGAFAYTQAHEAGGMDNAWASNMQGEGGIRSALNYHHPTKWIWAGDHWLGIREYHQSRGSVRYYQRLQPGRPLPQIEPGDIVLKDNARGTDPDHITTALTSDGQHLQTIGGNEGTARATDQNGVQRTQGSIDLARNPEANDVRQRDAQGRPIRDTTDPTLQKSSRVHGVGRWSIVDYEVHTYSAAAQIPTQAPVSSGSSRAGGPSRGGGGGGSTGGGGPAPAGGS